MSEEQENNVLYTTPHEKDIVCEFLSSSEYEEYLQADKLVIEFINNLSAKDYIASAEVLSYLDTENMLPEIREKYENLEKAASTLKKKAYFRYYASLLKTDEEITPAFFNDSQKVLSLCDLILKDATLSLQEITPDDYDKWKETHPVIISFINSKWKETHPNEDTEAPTQESFFYSLLKNHETAYMEALFLSGDADIPRKTAINFDRIIKEASSHLSYGLPQKTNFYDNRILPVAKEYKQITGLMLPRANKSDKIIFENINMLPSEERNIYEAILTYLAMGYKSFYINDILDKAFLSHNGENRNKVRTTIKELANKGFDIKDGDTTRHRNYLSDYDIQDNIIDEKSRQKTSLITIYGIPQLLKEAIDNGQYICIREEESRLHIQDDYSGKWIAKSLTPFRQEVIQYFARTIKEYRNGKPQKEIIIKYKTLCEIVKPTERQARGLWQLCIDILKYFRDGIPAVFENTQPLILNFDYLQKDESGYPVKPEKANYEKIGFKITINPKLQKKIKQISEQRSDEMSGRSDEMSGRSDEMSEALS